MLVPTFIAGQRRNIQIPLLNEDVINSLQNLDTEIKNLTRKYAVSYENVLWLVKAFNTVSNTEQRKLNHFLEKQEKN